MYVFLLLVYLYSFNKFSSHGTWQRTCDTKESEWQTCAFAEDLAAGEKGYRNRIVGGHRVRVSYDASAAPQLCGVLPLPGGLSDPGLGG